MKKVIREVIKDSIIVTLTLTCFVMSGHLKPKYQEFETKALTSNQSSTLDFNDVDLIACYGVKENALEWYINSTFIEDTTDYVLHKEITFDELDGKVKIEEINVTDDITNKALRIKAKIGDEWVNTNVLDFKEYTFENQGTLDIYLYYELSLLTKEDVLSSNGTDIEIVIGVE